MPPSQNQLAVPRALIGQRCPGPDPAPKPSRISPPPGSWDCHAHVFGPAARYPYKAARLYTPPDALSEHYATVLDTLGIAHAVLLQPSIYGSDNRCLLDALTRSAGRLRGVVAADPCLIDDKTIADWGKVGVCGVRVSMLSSDGVTVSDLSRISPRLAEIGWHISLLLDNPERLTDLKHVLRNLPCKLVIEQIGSMRTEMPITSPGFQTLLALLSDRAAFAKLSHAYHVSRLERPPYEDAIPLVRACIDAAPDRLVWGSDWPHAMMKGPMPNDGLLLDLLADWVGDRGDLHRILVDNPTELYGQDIDVGVSEATNSK